MGSQKRHNFTLTFDSVGAGWRKKFSTPPPKVQHFPRSVNNFRIEVFGS